MDWGWGVVVNYQKQRINPKKFVMGNSKNKDYIDVLQKSETHYIIDVLLYVKNKLTSDNVLQPGDLLKKDGRLGVVPVLLHHSSVTAISTIQMNLPSHNLVKDENIKQVEMLYNEIMKRFGSNGDKLPILDPLEDMEIEDKQLQELIAAKNKIAKELEKIEVKAQISEAQQMQYQRKQELKDEIRELEEAVKKSSEMIMKQDLVNMKRVMRRLELCDKNDVPTLKGKVACRISAADELVATELLFSGIFQDIDCYQIASLCSCLVYTDAKSEGKLTKDEKLSAPFLRLQQTADKIATVMIESKIPLERDEYVKQFNPDIMEIVCRWCHGAKFKDICDQATDIFEGTIIRGFRRLDELLSQMAEACKVIGNMELMKKFEEAQKNLKRGIVFTASLYL